MWRAVVDFSKAFEDFVLPPCCLLCDARLMDGSELVCRPCWERLPELPSQMAPPFSVSQIQGLPAHFSQHRAPWAYDGKVEELIQHFKYHGKRSLARALAGKMAEVLAADGAYRSADMLVPVPLHRVKQRERGYNQSWLLCEEIARLTGVEAREDVLRRVKNTKSQAHLDALERVHNVADAFAVVKPMAVQGRVVIVVDDVLTTGSTVDSCARVLREANAQEVLVLTAARAL